MVNAEEPKIGWLQYFKMKPSALDNICCFLGEFIGTALLVCLGCMGCVRTESWPNTPLQSSLNFGLVVLIIIQIFGCVSGAHLNPSVTVAAYIYNLVSLPMVFVYIAAQCLGAFVGYGLLKILLTPESIKPFGATHGLCVTVPHEDISSLQGFGIELIITGVLILICCGVWDPRNSKYQDSVGIRFGLAVSCLGLTAGQYTGASMNPARSLGPALWNHDFINHWIYWVAPITASCITALVYKTIFRREVLDEKSIIKLRVIEDNPRS